jgi:hypothetical protein
LALSDVFDCPLSVANGGGGLGKFKTWLIQDLAKFKTWQIQDLANSRLGKFKTWQIQDLANL